MALKDQPYIPLYIQDVLTDEKLMLCSAEAHGVYFRLMCILHKQPKYGCVLLKQKFKQTDSTCLNFAKMLAAFLPFTVDTIKDALQELSDEDVIQFDGDFLAQKRMVRDHALSVKRSIAGSKGGKKTASKKEPFAKEFATAKKQANAEYVYVNETDNEIDISNNGVPEKIEWENIVSFDVPEQVQDKWLQYERKRLKVFNLGDDKSIKYMPYDDRERGEQMESLYKSAKFDVEKVLAGLEGSINHSAQAPLYRGQFDEQANNKKPEWRSE